MHRPVRRVARRGALRRDTGRTVRPIDDWPTTNRRVALGDRNRPGDDYIQIVRGPRVVEDKIVSLRARQGRQTVEWSCRN
jgi:hypothetical protein